MISDEARAKLDFTHLGPEVTAAFEKNGVVCLRGLLDEAGVEDLRSWVDYAIKNPSPRFAGKPDRTYIVDTHLWPKLEGFRRVAFESKIPEAAAMITGGKLVRMYNDSMFVKEPSAPEPTPWHQDQPYFRLGGDNNCTAWIALDYANAASGAMTYALGSHRWGKLYSPISFAKPDQVLAEEGFDGAPPDIDHNPEMCETVGFDVRPGDVVFHNLLTLHKAGPNTTSGTRRRVHTIRFAAEDSVWINRPVSSVEFQLDLPDGSPLEGDDFPILWPRSAAAESQPQA